MTSISTPAVLSARELSVRYDGHAAVNGVDFAVSPGEIFGILGPSGAGKSSILAALTGIVPAGGQVFYGDADLSLVKASRRGFGHVYQEFRLFEWMTVFGNVAFPCRARQWTAERIESAVGAALAETELTESADRSVRDLSGGERQRVALARALVFGPRALFLDEPFSDLDPPLRRSLQNLIVDRVSQRRIPTIFVSHDHREAVALCTRIGVLFAGRLHQVAAPEELLRKPSTQQVAEFLEKNGTSVG